MMACGLFLYKVAKYVKKTIQELLSLMDFAVFLLVC